MRRHFTAIAVILTAATGCDNVTWGGIEVSVQAPNAANEGRPDGGGDTVPAPDVAAPRIGPLLLAGTRDGSSITLAPVGMLMEGVLERLPEPTDGPAFEAVLATLRAGTEWTLFTAGASVGTARVTSTSRDLELCGFDLVAVADAEVDLSASDARRFLALPPSVAANVGSRAYQSVTHDYDQRVASLALGRDAVPRVGAAWPADGMLPVRRDIQAFRPEGTGVPSIAASFVVDDQLDTSTASPGSWAMFLLADQRPDGFRETYVWYRSGSDGKAAPWLFDHLDWDADGTAELLLEVFGEGRRGWLTLDRTADGSWSEAFRGACPHTAVVSQP
jgi:hypothetical protein